MPSRVSIWVDTNQILTFHSLCCQALAHRESSDCYLLPQSLYYNIKTVEVPVVAIWCYIKKNPEIQVDHKEEKQSYIYQRSRGPRQANMTSRSRFPLEKEYYKKNIKRKAHITHITRTWKPVMLISTSFLFMDSIRENVHDSQSNIERGG